MNSQRLTIVKLGGSIVTYKEKAGKPVPRKKIISQLANEFSSYFKSTEERFIFVYGAGSFGHRLAKKYDLANLKSKTKNKQAISLTHQSVQKLSSIINEVFLSKKCPVFHLSTASLVKQKNGRIISFSGKSLKLLLSQGFIPTLNGDMVIDEKRQFSICSGDQLASYLANLLMPKRVIFLTDVDGVFRDNPKINAKTALIKEIKRKGLIKMISRTEHSSQFDITGSMKGKLKEIAKIKNDVYIVNGLIKNNFLKTLRGEKVGTRIFSS